MTYREKVAYLYLFGMILGFGAYFLYVALNPQFYDFYILDKVKILGACAVTNMTIIAIGHLWFFKTINKEDRIAFDERDAEIDAKSTKIAYHILIYCALFTGAIMPFFSTPWKIANTMMFFIVISETVRGLIVINSYRKQRP